MQRIEPIVECVYSIIKDGVFLQKHTTCINGQESVYFSCNAVRDGKVTTITQTKHEERAKEWLCAYYKNGMKYPKMRLEE